MPDCIECFKELSSEYELAGRELCMDCDAHYHHESYLDRKAKAEDDVERLIKIGYSCTAAAMAVQDEHNLSDNDVDRMADEYMLALPDLEAQWRGEI